MENKCPKCGYIPDATDIYCAKCGTKLTDIDFESDNDYILDDEINNLSALDVFNADNISEDKKNNSSLSPDFQPRSTRNFFDGFVLNFIIVVLIISAFLLIFLFSVLEKQNTKRLELQYKNLLNNPQQIPELIEPASFSELSENLSDIESFLMLYLKFSDDTTDKKERVFISYLKEINKLPHITSENMIKDTNDKCYKIDTPSLARYCSARFNKEFKDIGIITYPDFNTVYLYPDYRFINKKYSKYLSKSLSEYMKLRAEYYEPLTIGTKLYIRPRKLADKIYDFEKLYNSSTSTYVKDDLEEQIYNNFRKFIFTPSIYDTTTQEMTNDFKYAYQYFINTKKGSMLRPVVMSYFDKKRSYSNDNFKQDYPFKSYEATFDENVQNNAFNDIFIELRKNIFSKNSNLGFNYVYSTIGAKWKKYQPNMFVGSGEYIISEPDENNNISIYNNTFSFLHELNIPKFSSLFILNDSLYIFNNDKLSISKIVFNGKMFVLQNLAFSDVSSLFPGIQVINIDSYSNYNIYIEKDNQKANYIILSRYSQGFNKYSLSSIKGQFSNSVLPNMFGVSSNDDIVISYHNKETDPEATSETSPTYRFIIHTRGHSEDKIENQSDDFVQYDEHTASQHDNEEEFKPNIMPKIDKNNIQEDDLSTPPEQTIEPPKNDD